MVTNYKNSILLYKILRVLKLKKKKSIVDIEKITISEKNINLKMEMLKTAEKLSKARK